MKKSYLNIVSLTRTQDSSDLPANVTTSKRNSLVEKAGLDRERRMIEEALKTYLVNVLGCKVNQYDARQIEELLEEYGLQPVELTDDADVIVIHTCAVTAAAAKKSRQTIRRMQRDNPLAHIRTLLRLRRSTPELQGLRVGQAGTCVP